MEDAMETRKAKYGSYGEVIILESGPTTTKIQTNPNDEFSYMWVKTDKLVFPKSPKAGKATVAVDIETTSGPAIAVSVNPKDFTGNYSGLVQELRRLGFSFYLHTREAGVAKGEAEYREWTNGESLPESAIYVHEKSIGHTWRLHFQISPDTTLPFEVVPMGTVGRSFNHARTAPRGLRRENGHIDVNFAEIAEQLVRAGLRVNGRNGVKEL